VARQATRLWTAAKQQEQLIERHEVCDKFHVAVSNPDNIALSGMMTNELEMVWKETVVA
jgi:NAD(P)H-nitrite reductase large subunit